MIKPKRLLAVLRDRNSNAKISVRGQLLALVASHADVLRGSSRVPLDGFYLRPTRNPINPVKFHGLFNELRNSVL